MSSPPRRPASRPRLRELALRLGVIPGYVDQTGRRVRRTTDDTREALLAVMGFDAPTEDAARAWLAELDHQDATTILAPVRVVQRDAASARTIRVRVPPLPGAGSATIAATVLGEDGTEWLLTARARTRATLRLPAPLPYGYHRIRLTITMRGREHQAEQTLIVVPARCVAPQALLGDDRVYGVIANLYALRRERDWGLGDFTALAQLVEWGTPRGAEFVGMNPLHALRNRGAEISPYSPVSRLFRNHIYIDVADLPQSLLTERVRSLLAEHWQRIERLRAQPFVQYDDVIALKEEVLREAHAAFERRREGAERREFEDFTRLRDPELGRYATWMAIADGADSADWRAWPPAMRDPESAAVRAFCDAHPERVEFHRWAQFETYRQLGAVAARARGLGMRIGLYQDLAIGSAPGGSDTWSFPGLFLRGAAVGAPPDPYSAAGQNWGLPPIDPRSLRAQAYRYWVQLLRRAFEHAGALRIDHVMGLFRGFWIPDGGTGADGAYVRYPADDMLGILALESVRHNAVVVGEDLGTVPAGVPRAMKRRGILSSKVLYFEKDARGFKPASRYPELALATANTHDMPTIAGFWSGSDVALRHELGLAGSDREYRVAQKERARDRASLLKRVKLARTPEGGESFARRLTAAVHDFLCSTPARLVGISYDDVLGEQTPVNVPGVGADKYPSWRRRNRMTIEEASWSREVDDTIRCPQRRRGSP